MLTRRPSCSKQPWSIVYSHKLPDFVNNSITFMLYTSAALKDHCGKSKPTWKDAMTPYILDREQYSCE